VDVVSWLAAAADWSLSAASLSTRDSRIADMLNCSKLSGAGDGTFSKVPEVDNSSVAEVDVCIGG